MNTKHWLFLALGIVIICITFIFYQGTRTPEETTNLSETEYQYLNDKLDGKYFSCGKVTANSKGFPATFRIVDVDPPHEFIIDSISGELEIYSQNIKHSNYSVWVEISTEKGKDTAKIGVTVKGINNKTKTVKRNETFI